VAVGEGEVVGECVGVSLGSRVVVGEGGMAVGVLLGEGVAVWDVVLDGKLVGEG
jgi:hypothetical protein